MLLIFLTTSSEEELVERLRARNTENKADLEMRIATARKEFLRVDEFDYVVVNQEDRLQEAVAQVVDIINAEHQRVEPRQVKL